jgi:hypothetical protein
MERVGQSSEEQPLRQLYWSLLLEDLGLDEPTKFRAGAVICGSLAADKAQSVLPAEPLYRRPRR